MAKFKLQVKFVFCCILLANGRNNLFLATDLHRNQVHRHDSDWVLCTLENYVIQQSLWNSTIMPPWQFML